MRRDYFTFGLADIEAKTDGRPAVQIEFDGPADDATQRLTPERDVDVAYRFQTPVDDDDADGVFSVADRMTGEFLMEVNVDATDILTLIDAARAYSETHSDAEDCYTVCLDAHGERVFEMAKRTLLVYDNEGSLLRQHSLIPSGVEL
jgi:hypothetical protein